MTIALFVFAIVAIATVTANDAALVGNAFVDAQAGVFVGANISDPNDQRAGAPYFLIKYSFVCKDLHYFSNLIALVVMAKGPCYFFALAATRASFNSGWRRDSLLFALNPLGLVLFLFFILYSFFKKI